MVATRKYTPIWQELKTKGTVRITAPKPFHRRIIRAVIKEKYMDLEYHLVMSEQNRKQKLHYRTNQSVVTFNLVENRILEML